MQILIIAAMVAALSFEFLASNGWLPQLLTYSPEVLGVGVAVLVIVTGVRSRFKYVRPMYWLVFGGLAIIVICGAVVNHLEPGTMFAGLRIYLRALPFFFLPAVLEIKERQLRVQMLLLLVFGLLQLPIAWEQRMRTFTRGPTTGDLTYAGDNTFGTLMGSGLLTVFLICAACVLTGFFLRKRISAKMFFPLIFLLLVPTMLNETKSTLLILPVALITCFVIGAKPGARLKNTALALVMTACFVAVFIPVYDHFVSPRWGYGIVDFFAMEGRLEGYLDRGSQIGEYERNAGKLGGLKVALSEISRDPVKLTFGLGIGNVSDSALGQQFSGNYFKIYAVFITSSAIRIIFELGLVGFALVLLLYWLLFKDSVFVMRNNQGIMGALAIAWTGVVMAMLIGMFSNNLIESRALSVLFWYFSGVVAAHRMREAISAVEDATDLAGPRYVPRAGGLDGTA